MGDFTPDIQAPANAWMIGRGAEAPKSLVGTLADSLTPVVQKGMDMYRENKKNDLMGKEDAALSGIVQDYANPSQSQPQLVGQSTDPADSSATVQDGRAQLDKYGKAMAQGRMTREEALTRASTTTSRLISENPYYADALRDHAQKVLGFNPNASLFEEASKAEEFKQTLSNAASEIMFKEAVSNGAPVFVDNDPSKGIDQSATMEVGRKFLASKAEVAAQMQTLEMQLKSQKAPLTHDELVGQQYGALRPHIDDILTASAPGLLTGVSKTLQNIGPNATDKQRNEVFAQIGMAETQAVLNAHQYMRTYNVDPSTEKAIDEHIHTQFAAYHTLATGDLSSNGLLQKNLNDMVARNKVRFHEVAPAAAALVDVGGPVAAGDVFGAIAGTKGSSVDTQTTSYINGTPKPVDTISKTADALNGTYDPSKEQSPAHAIAVSKALVTTINSYTARPQNLSPQEQAGFGNAVVGVGRTALSLSDRTQIQYASHTLNSPAFLQTFDSYAKNPINADHVPVVAGYVRDVNMANIEKASQFVRNGGDLKLPVMAVSNTGPFGSRGSSAGGSIKVHFSAAYDPAKGQVEPNFSATDASGKRVTLSGDQVSSVMNQTKDFRSSVSELNRSLQTVSHMAKYPGGMGGDDKSEKEFHVQNNGIPFKAGTKPSIFQTTDATPEAQRLSGSYAERVHTIFKGAKVTSADRTEAENESAGGAKNSMHLRGQALDFDWPGHTKEEVRAVLESHGLPVTELFDAKDEASMGKGHMGKDTFHWGWGEKENKKAMKAQLEADR